MSVKVKIKHLKPGTVFHAGPVAVRVLEHFADGKTLVITDECIADRPFTCQPFKPNRPEGWKANNWRTSTLRADLNRDFLNSFDEAGGPILSENIISTEWNLTDSAGNNAYGSVTDKIGLLTEAMFRKYSEQGLLDLDDWWWLITPCAGCSYHARIVYTDGTLDNYYAHGGSGGVRPALYVESEIEVELELEIMTARAAATARNNEILKNHFLSSARFRSVLPHYVTKKEVIEINEPCTV